MKNSLRNKLRTQYENHSQIPSENLWERIDLMLENTEEKEFLAAKKINYWMYAAIFLMVVSVGITLNYLLNEKQPTPKIAGVTNEIIKKQDSFKVNENSENQISAKKSSEKLANQESSVPLEKSFENNFQKNYHQKILNEKPHTDVTKIISAENKTDSPKTIILDNASNPVLAQQPTSVKEKTTYITANELLFGREVDKSYKEQQDNDEGKMGLSLKKPREVKILGITVYSDEQ